MRLMMIEMRHYYYYIVIDSLPRLPGALHDVCQCDIVAPNIELPLSQTEHPAVNPDMGENFVVKS